MAKEPKIPASEKDFKRNLLMLMYTTTKTDDKPLVEINAKDLLQANATIIAGVLILLTLVVSVTDSLKSLTKIMMASAIVPFVISTFYLVVQKINHKVVSNHVKWAGATWFTALGLIYLCIAVIILLMAM